MLKCENFVETNDDLNLAKNTYMCRQKNPIINDYIVNQWNT